MNSCGHFSQDFRHRLFFARPRTTWKQRTSSQKTSRTGSSSCQYSLNIAWKKNDENCISTAEEVRNYAMKILQGHWTFLGPGSEEKWYGSANHDQKGTGIAQANKMVQRFKETGHLVFKRTSALSRRILKQKKGRCTFHFNVDSTNTELLFQTTAQCLRSSCELVLSIRLDRRGKRTRRYWS